MERRRKKAHHRAVRVPLLRLACVSLAGLLLAGATCAPYQRVGVESSPEGSEVYLDGELVGTTPMTLRVSTQTDHSVYVKREGYRSELRVLSANQPSDRIDFLTPADLEVRLVLTLDPLGRDLEVETEESEPERE